MLSQYMALRAFFYFQRWSLSLTIPSIIINASMAVLSQNQHISGMSTTISVVFVINAILAYFMKQFQIDERTQFFRQNFSAYGKLANRIESALVTRFDRDIFNGFLADYISLMEHNDFLVPESISSELEKLVRGEIDAHANVPFMPHATPSTIRDLRDGVDGSRVEVSAVNRPPVTAPTRSADSLTRSEAKRLNRFMQSSTRITALSGRHRRQLPSSGTTVWNGQSSADLRASHTPQLRPPPLSDLAEHKHADAPTVHAVDHTRAISEPALSS